MNIIDIITTDAWTAEQIEARDAGRAWAEREAEVASDQGRAVEGPWQGTTADALPLVGGDDAPRRRELADIANDAAAARWDELVASSGTDDIEE